MARNVGANAVCNDVLRSAPANFRLFIAIFDWSNGSNVASNVVATVPLALALASANVSNSNVPFLMASTINTAPFVPNT